MEERLIILVPFINPSKRLMQSNPNPHLTITIVRKKPWLSIKILKSKHQMFQKSIFSSFKIGSMIDKNSKQTK